jgi:hypothetical protein
MEIAHEAAVPGHRHCCYSQEEEHLDPLADLALAYQVAGDHLAHHHSSLAVGDLAFPLLVRNLLPWGHRIDLHEVVLPGRGMGLLYPADHVEERSSYTCRWA